MKQNLESIIFEIKKAKQEMDVQDEKSIEKNEEINPELKELMEYSK